MSADLTLSATADIETLPSGAATLDSGSFVVRGRLDVAWDCRNGLNVFAV